MRGSGLYIRVLALVAVLVLVAAVPAAACPESGVRIAGTSLGEDSMNDPTDRCEPSDGPYWLYRNEGAGWLSLLGRVTVVVEHCSYFDPMTGSGTFRDGTVTFTAKDGSGELVISQTGSFRLVPPEPGAEVLSLVNGTWEVVGGSGPYQGAGGSGTMRAIGFLERNETRGFFGGRVVLDD